MFIVVLIVFLVVCDLCIDVDVGITRSLVGCGVVIAICFAPAFLANVLT